MLGVPRSFAILALTGSALLLPAPAWAQTAATSKSAPSAASAPSAPSASAPSLPGGLPIPTAGAAGQLPAGSMPLLEKPSLLKELPIAAYCLTGVTAIVGAIVNVFGGNAIKELKDPSKHTTPDQTHSLVVRARVGQVVSGVFFGFTGASAAWGTFSTIRAVKKISSFIKLPPVGVSAGLMPGGAGVGVQGEF